MPDNNQKIIVETDGPYIVEGGVPLVRKSPVMSEHGEPLTWKKDEVLQTRERYYLCRCGKSTTKPFCDESHAIVGFSGKETADTNTIVERQTDYEGTRITVKDDRSLCMHAGFCGNQVTNVWKMTQDTDTIQVYAQIMAMIGRCPSGALTKGAWHAASHGARAVEARDTEGVALESGAVHVSINHLRNS